VPDNGLKNPFYQTMPTAAKDVAQSLIDISGKSIPASIVEIDKTNTIVKVKFEVETDYTLPVVQCPVIGPEYVRLPLKVGDKGYVSYASFYLGGMSGIGGGKATLDQWPNLSCLVFNPLGNTDFEETPNQNAVVNWGPEGVINQDKDAEIRASFLTDGVEITRNIGASFEPDTTHLGLLAEGETETLFMNDNEISHTYKDQVLKQTDTGTDIYGAQKPVTLRSGNNTIGVDPNHFFMNGTGNYSFNMDDTGIVMSNGAGYSIHIGPSSIDITTPGASISLTAANIAMLATAISIMGKDFITHKHTGVQTGSGDTGGVL
jgi:hypothetical protein